MERICVAHGAKYDDHVGCMKCEDEAVALAENVDDDSYTEYAWSGSDY